MQLYKLTEQCSVAGQIQSSDIETLKRDGFVTIVCNRPDGEDFGQPTAAEIASQCERLGVAFHHLPISNTGITAEIVAEFRNIVTKSNGQVLAYCRSGQRSSVLWQYSGGP